MDELRLPFTERLSPVLWVAIDVAFAAILAIACVSSGHLVTPAGHPARPTISGWAFLRDVCIGVICVAVPFRRFSPRAVLAAIALGLAVLFIASGPQVAVLALLPATYSVASTAINQTSFREVVAALVVVEAGAFSSRVVRHNGAALAALALAMIGWLAGENTRARRGYVKGMLQRAAEREREREQQARRAGAEERMRIARELHDVVAHAMSIIAVRSGVARLVLETRPEEAREALAIIEETSHEALQELRALVGVLRGDDDVAHADYHPAPGLANLSELVTHVNEAGVAVNVRVEGRPRPLAPGVDLSAYRIVQEALTNVVRHAAPASAELTLRYRPSEVVIEVTDDGGSRRRALSSTTVDTGAGHGIVGMRERAAVYGGKLIAEATTSGFRVLAHIPTEEVGP